MNLSHVYCYNFLKTHDKKIKKKKKKAKKKKKRKWVKTGRRSPPLIATSSRTGRPTCPTFPTLK